MTSRSIDSRFWSDGWVRLLNSLDRYLFIYLLTNSHSTWCGVYELDIAMMAFESGIDKEDLTRSILPRLSPKVIYVDGWVYIPNWMKYHLSSGGTISPQQKKGFETAWSQVPQRIRDKIKEIEEKGYPMVRVSPSSSALTSSSTYSSVAIAPQVTESPEEEKPKKESKAKYPHSKEVFGLWGKFPLAWKNNTTQLVAAENLYTERGVVKIKDALDWYDHAKNKFDNDPFLPVVTSPYDLDTKWGKLEAFDDKHK